MAALVLADLGDPAALPALRRAAAGRVPSVRDAVYEVIAALEAVHP